MNQKTWSDYSNIFNDNSLIMGFTNKKFPHIPPNDRTEFAKLLSLNPGTIVKPKQVHSNIVEECNQPGEIFNIDGIITTNADLVLSIQVADCIPIFLYDKRSKVIGLVHAGWKGISDGIVENCIDLLNTNISNLSDVKILLGPSIRQCCFEIGPEVAELFDQKYMINGKGDRSHLNLQSTVIEKFIMNGISESNIIDIDECTYCSGNYHSYRKNGKKAGRMIAMMGWKN